MRLLLITLPPVILFIVCKWSDVDQMRILLIILPSAIPFIACKWFDIDQKQEC